MITPNAVIKQTDHSFSHLGKSIRKRIAKTKSKRIIKANGMSIDFSDFFKEVLSIRQLHLVSEVSDSFSSVASLRLSRSSAKSYGVKPLLSIMSLIAPFISNALRGRPLPS